MAFWASGSRMFSVPPHAVPADTEVISSLCDAYDICSCCVTEIGRLNANQLLAFRIIVVDPGPAECAKRLNNSNSRNNNNNNINSNSNNSSNSSNSSVSYSHNLQTSGIAAVTL